MYSWVSTLHLRAERKLYYNIIIVVFKAYAVKALPTNSINTDTDFSNNQSTNTYTLGIGYRGSLFYADLAYKYNTYKSDFYPFYNDINGLVTAPATKVTNTRSQVLLTVGIRF